MLKLHHNKKETATFEHNTARRNRWFFGGIASAMATCVTHPLEVLKVHLQTQNTKSLSIAQIIRNVLEQRGFAGFYAGISGALCHKLTYNLSRFGIYESGKHHMNKDDWRQVLGLALGAGAAGGFIGLPADVVTVRMAADSKLPEHLQRNYKHVFDGIRRIIVEEGARTLFTGGTFVVGRAMIATCSQNLLYDKVKQSLLSTGTFDDNVVTHGLCSLATSFVTIVSTQPLDVMKTMQMHAKKNKYRNLFHLFQYTLRMGPAAFFRGSVPTFLRVGPQYMLLFIFMEQMRFKFGYLPNQK